MATLDAGELATMVNSYSISRARPKEITIPTATELSGYRDVTVTGTLVGRQLMQIQADGITRKPAPPSKKLGDKYPLQADGDVHFSLGTSAGKAHVACEVQRARRWLHTINDSIGNQITVSGFFRCLFEHPGFAKGADAHIFEIHPVREIDFGDGNGSQPFKVGKPEPQSIHKWINKQKKRNLNTEDAKTTVEYDPTSDSLTFSGMKGMDLNYVDVKGTVSGIQLKKNSSEPAVFTFDGDDIDNPVTVYCLKQTNASEQLEGLKKSTHAIRMVALRNIDLAEAKDGSYTINLLAIDIKPA